jgi:hypothetical protein
MIEYQEAIVAETRSAIRQTKQPSGVVEFEIDKKDCSIYIEAEFAISLNAIDVYYTLVVFTNEDNSKQVLSTQERHYLSKLFYNYIN